MFLSYNWKDLIDNIDQLQVWRWLIGWNVHVDEKFVNPWRVDTKPGCWLYKWNSSVYLSDFASSTFHGKTCFHVIQMLYQCSWNQAVNMAYNLEGSKLKESIKVEYNVSQERKKYKITYEKRDWRDFDIEFWNSHKIYLDNLKEDNVYPITKYYLDDMKFYADKLAYAFQFDNSCKIYQPDNIFFKWSTDVDENVVGMWNEEEVGDICIITKGYKEARQLRNNGFIIYWINGEKFYLKDDKLVSLFERFDNIYFIYDNDKAGKEESTKRMYEANTLLETDKFKVIYLPEEGYNDIDEYFVNDKEEEILKWIRNKL